MITAEPAGAAGGTVALDAMVKVRYGDAGSKKAGAFHPPAYK